ncbi:MAG: MCE family protein [Betaproteobacteria bacterium]|nr:MCE family protein [Betaproteobacteria bacterium]
MKPSSPSDFDELLGQPPARRRAWLFILPAILGLILLVVGVALKQGYFIRRVNLNFYAPTADGISVGTKIKLLGFPVGAISGVTFVPASAGQPRRVKLQARVDAEYLAHIPTGSLARLAQEGVIGEHVIEIVPGSDNARPVAAGEAIELKKEGGLGGLASMVETRVMPVVDEARVLLGTLNDERAGVKPVLADVRGLLASAGTTAQRAENLLEQSEAKLGNLLGDGEAAMKSARMIAGATDQRATELLDDARSVLKNAKTISEDGANIVRDLKSAAPGLLDDGRSAAADASQIAHGAKQSWPFRLLVDDAPAPPSLGVDTGRVLPAASGAAK